MNLRLLGTAGYHPSDTRQTMSLLLPDVGVALDAGTGFYRAADYLQTDELDVFITHAHLDHVVGLTYLFDVVRRHPLKRVTVHGEPAKLEAIERHLLNEALFPARPPFELAPLRERESLAGGGHLTHFSVEHPGGAVGYRLDWPGHALAYVTDTTAAAAAPYVEAVRGVDLLVHECNFPDSQADLAAQWGHSSLSQVAHVAQAAQVGSLVLVHVDPLAGHEPLDLAAARAIFPTTSVGNDRQELHF